jgi:hypothetical protein
MAQHQNQFSVQVFHCILNAAQTVISGNVSRYADNK